MMAAISFPALALPQKQVSSSHRLNMEFDLQSLFWVLCASAQLYSLAETTQPLPPAHKRGRYWSAKIDDISL
jgi:hypothetical protein